MTLQSHTIFALRHEELQPMINSWAAFGHALRSLAMYGPAAEPHYACIFQQLPPGMVVPDQFVDGPFPLNAITSLVAQKVFEGFAVQQVVITGDEDLVQGTIFSLGPGMVAGNLSRLFRFGNEQDIADALGQADSLNQNVLSIDGCTGPDGHVLSVLLETNPQRRKHWEVLFATRQADPPHEPQWAADPRAIAIQEGWARHVAVVPLEMGRRADGSWSRGVLLC